MLAAVAEASMGAVEGVGVFAWATAYGLEAFFAVDGVSRLASLGRLRLVIGTDSITDLKALLKAEELQGRYPRVDISFVVNAGNNLFHPKLCWFERPNGTRLIVGSANLTRGGLQGNWEASAVLEVDSAELSRAVDDWLDGIEPGALLVSDQRVREAVADNIGDERSTRRARRSTTPVIPEPPASSEVDSWLVAELNKSRKNSAGQSLFSQASFDESTFTKFFGYPGVEFELGLIPVADDGSLGALESRKGRFKSASVNYYFELGAVQGVPYPASGRPVAVFGRLAGGGYLYLVRLPGEAGHQELEGVLARVDPSPGTRMRREVVAADVIRDAWPAAPILVTPAIPL